MKVYGYTGWGGGGGGGGEVVVNDTQKWAYGMSKTLHALHTIPARNVIKFMAHERIFLIRPIYMTS